MTDIAYPPLFHPEQAQAMMALAAILNGFDARPAGRAENFHYVDLGCGPGLTALITAAANPGWVVTGLDFNPAHIAQARALARAAGLANARFFEADLRDFAQSPAGLALPGFDAVTMHGVWSWVSAAVQDGILRLLEGKLAPGGLCHVSYNLATGWRGASGLQAVVRAAGAGVPGGSDRQAAAGLGVARALAAAGADFGDPGLLEKLARMPPAYLAHELMNAHWRPLLHADVAAFLAGAGLRFAGSATLLNNVPEFALAPGVRAVLAPLRDAALAETVKDICRPALLRHDVFIRGGRRAAAAARDAALAGLTLGLAADEPDWRFTFPAAAGAVAMDQAFYLPVFNRLKAGPARLDELAALPGLRGGRGNLAELAAVAIGTGQAVLLPNPGAPVDDVCARLNDLLLRRQLAAGGGAPVAPGGGAPVAPGGGAPVALAAPALGGGLALPAAAALLAVAGGPAAGRPAARAPQPGRDTAALLRHLGFPV